MRRNERIPDQEKEENRIAQEEEIEALEAIYGDAFEVVTRGSAASPHEVRIRVSEIPMVSLQLRLPEGYPSRDLPDVEIRSPGLGQAVCKDLSAALRRPEREATKTTGYEGGNAAPSSSPRGGTVVIFDWAEMLKDLMSRTGSSSHSDPVADRPKASPGQERGDWVGGRAGVFEDGDEENTGGWVRAIPGSGGGGGGRGSRGAFGEDEAEYAVPEEGFVEIFHGEPFTDRKSTFQAHLARVSSERQVSWVRRRLLENGKIARATHNIAAWRVWDEARGVQLHDNDDDGETAAGSRLAHMLAITGSQNVLVVVSRWFGGIHLGPDRFKHINNAARELLVQCGATAAAASGGVGESKPGPAVGGKHRGRRKRGSGAGGK